MLELILGVLLAAGATYFVLLPILRPPVESASDAQPGDEGEDPADDMSPQTVALRALKEIEFDRATGKLSDADYESLKAQYTAEALAVMRETGGVVPPPISPPVTRLPSPACPVHGPPREPGADFCSACGRRLQEASGFCGRCGTPLERDAQFCHRCGSRVAA